MRPALEEEKFPSERSIQLSPEVAARVQAQESAGRLVFEVGPVVPVTTVETKPVSAPVAVQTEERVPGSDSDAAGAYVQHSDHTAPATVR